MSNFVIVVEWECLVNAGYKLPQPPEGVRLCNVEYRILNATMENIHFLANILSAHRDSGTGEEPNPQESLWTIEHGPWIVH